MHNILNRLEKIMHECQMIKAALLKPEYKERKVVPGFLKFWDIYPKKENMVEAQREWDVSVTEADAPMILKALARTKWDADQRFIPSPHRWLKNKRWLDAKKEANDGKYQGHSETI